MQPSPEVLVGVVGGLGIILSLYFALDKFRRGREDGVSRLEFDRHVEQTEHAINSMREELINMRVEIARLGEAMRGLLEQLKHRAPYG